tara:strand:- start:4445 stop:5746 length:1302 start_codon:yes stop_codon:yes gene_type:complete
MKTQDGADLRKRLDQLESRRRDAKDKAAEIFARAQNEERTDYERDLTTEELSEVREHQTAAVEAQQQIDVIREQLGLSDTADEGKVHLTKTGDAKRGDGDEQTDDERRYDDAFETWVRRGARGLSDEQVDILETGVANDEQRAALNTIADGDGGYAVPEGFINRIDDIRKKYSWMDEAGVTILRTEAGNDLPMPVSDGTSEVGEILDQETAATQQDPTFTTQSLSSYLYSSKEIRVSRALLQDAGVDILGFIARRLGQRLGRITSLHATTGDGSGKPEGVVTSAGAAVTAASETAITFEEILELQHGPDPAYRMNGRFMFNDATLLLLRKLKDSEGRPLWQPSLIGGIASTLMGSPYTINQNMAAAATSSVPMLFGDFSTYYWRIAREMVLFDIDDSLRSQYQRGFVAFARYDGKVMEARGEAIQKLTMDSGS